jgi:hypothetical protein
MRGLTSLFGMGRGEHPRQNHHKKVVFRAIKAVHNINALTYWKKKLIEESLLNKIKAYEQLVLLGFAVTSFTPVAYQRSRLLRLLKVNSS